MHYVLLIAGLAYVALHRVVVRRKLRIKPCCGCPPGGCRSFLGEWCLLFWCLPCALCQVRGQPPALPFTSPLDCRINLNSLCLAPRSLQNNVLKQAFFFREWCSNAWSP